MNVRIALLACLVALPPFTTSAGWGDFVKDKANEAAKRKTGEAINQGADAAVGKGKEAGKSQKHEEAKPKDGGDEAEATPSKGGGEATAKGKDGGAPAVKDEVAAGEVYSPKFDFVPGDKVLVFDDFAETDVGEYPARWTVKDHGGGNAVEVVQYKGRKWLKSVPAADGINRESTHWLRYDPKGDLPKKFTIEFDADMATPFAILFNTHRGYGGREIHFDAGEVQSQNVKAQIPVMGKVVKRVSISVNGTYVKAYIGGARVLQDPDAVERPIKRLGWKFDDTYGRKNSSEDPDRLEHQMFTAFRLAEGGKDVTQALNSEGRIVVHGIYFDTGSDVIKPESGGALRNVLTVMNDNPQTLFMIEGHTDNQGGAAVNGPLSDKRAAAVKAWLVSQGVDANRLGAKGMGATKPIDSNDTQEGRAMNRRVEFVKVDRLAGN